MFFFMFRELVCMFMDTQQPEVYKVTIISNKNTLILQKNGSSYHVLPYELFFQSANVAS